MKNNLSLSGSEIINENKSKYNNYNNISLMTPNKDQKIILKSYKIKDEHFSNSNNNSTKNKIIISQKKESQTKKINTLDLSKIKYSDGYILTDAANSNPGFGLWALKLTDKENEKSIKTNKIDINRKSINNISTIKNNITSNSNINKISIITNNISNNKFNDKSHSISINSKNDELKKRNKLLIDHLKMKCNDLENKCINLVSNLDQKIYMCNNSVKLKREYEQLLHENIRETNLIKEKSNSLSLENSKLSNVYKNIENELNRLINVIKTDKDNMEKLQDEFKARLVEEERERQKLNGILKEIRDKIDSLEKETNEKLNENIINENKNNQKYNIEIMNKKASEARKEFENDNLNDIILELELKICEMKKKINSQEEENEKLRKILRFKEEKNGIEKNQLNNLNFLLNFKKENQKNDLNIVSRQDILIKELKNKTPFNKDKLAKSVSLKKINK